MGLFVGMGPGPIKNSNLDARKKYFSFLRAFAAVAPVTFIAFPQLMRK